jgi:hypothetical protein
MVLAVFSNKNGKNAWIKAANAAPNSLNEKRDAQALCSK